MRKIEKCKSFRLLSEDDFSKIANGDMEYFVNFWGYYGLRFHISIDIVLQMTENMQFTLTFNIKLVSFKNIDI